MSETPHQVFEALLADWYDRVKQAADMTRELDSQIDAERDEWQARFDAAADEKERAEQLAVFVEALREGLAKWVAHQAADAAKWISVEKRLPVPATPDTPQPDILFFVSRQHSPSSVEYGYFDGRRWATYEIHGKVGRYNQDERVTHWRPLPEPPITG